MGAWFRRNRGRLILILIVFNVTISLGKRAIDQTYLYPGPLQMTRSIVIPPDGTRGAARILKTDGAIDYALIFRAAVWLTRQQGPVHAGEFVIRAHSSLRDILQILRFGAVVQHQVTIPEGLTGSQIAKLLNAAPAATGTVADPAEGSVLPQTYDYIYATPRADILHRAGAAMAGSLAAAWASRAPGLIIATPAQALTLAAIVQEETPLPAELPLIAAVYENRLRQGMKLQADPTVIFAASHGALASGGMITRTALATASPYNTYLYPGLPPGPICAPGLAALNAVLHPAATDDLYFVATGTGGHVFAATYQQHLQNVARYRAAQQKQPAD